MNYTKDEIKRLKENYDLESINWYIEIALRDLKLIQDYLFEAKTQKEKVQNSSFAFQVYFKREAYNKVHYYVGLKTYPLIPENQEKIIIYNTSECEKFAGKDKKKAREYAEVLAEKYSCKIEYEGYKGGF